MFYKDQLGLHEPFVCFKGSNLALANFINASSFSKKSKLKLLSHAIFSK